MNRRSRAFMAMMLGGVTVRLVLTNKFGWFVHQRMRYPLLVAGAALVLIGLYDAVHDTTKSKEGDEHEHEHEHEHNGIGNRVGWLLMAPLLVLVGVSPSALGADAAGRFATYDPGEATGQAEELPASGTVELSLYEFRNYAFATDQLRDRTVELTGFVVNDQSDVADGFVLTRFLIGCCAADAFRLEVQVHGVAQTWADDTWVKVTGTWIEPVGGSYPEGVDLLLEVQAIEVIEVATPDAPYESLW